MLCSTISVSFFKLFTTVAITYHLITFVENTSLDVTGSLVCKQTAVVSYFMYLHIYFLCFGMFFVVDIIHQSGTVNYKISLDKIVGIFSNRNIYICLDRKYSQTVFSCTYQLFQK